MRRFRDTLGLKATQAESGKSVGRVTDVALTKDGQEIVGFLLSRRSLFGKRRFVPFSGVRLFGERTVEVEQAVDRRMENERPLIGQTVRDTSGILLGWVTDGMFSETTGQVYAIEVSYGLLEDFSLGRALLCDFILRPEGVVVLSGAGRM